MEGTKTRSYLGRGDNGEKPPVRLFGSFVVSALLKERKKLNRTGFKMLSKITGRDCGRRKDANCRCHTARYRSAMELASSHP